MRKLALVLFLGFAAAFAAQRFPVFEEFTRVSG
jgi:hypothetical protein